MGYPQTALASSLEDDEPLAIALRRLPIFEDLDQDQMAWFAGEAESMSFSPGDVVVREGEPADFLFVLLEGEIQGRSVSLGLDAPVYTARAGQVTGMLPFSRLTHFPLTSRAVLPSRGARLHKDNFPEMIRRIPQLLPRLMGVLADRIRESSRTTQQHEKLRALGKLAAGLAHELNNPATAASRSAEALRISARHLRRIDFKLAYAAFSSEQITCLHQLEEEIVENLCNGSSLDALAQSDLEDPVRQWLNRHNITAATELAGPLVEARITVERLSALRTQFEGPVLESVIEHFAHAIAAEKLTDEIHAATGRIFELIQAIKDYSYMDQMPEQEVDIHEGIENTLTILNFRLRRARVKVIRHLDRSLPNVCVQGRELNQVWTNLIENAIDAMESDATLAIRTSRQLEFALVEIQDNGRGIPEDIQSRVFEPFFTTKPTGEGSGLGLDTVYRIIRNHRGDVSFVSRPGSTTFTVRLPFRQPHQLST